MGTTNMDLKASMEAIAAAAAGAGGAHPSAEQLLSYHDGTLENSEREQVVWHLAACADCTQAVLDMARFPEVEVQDPRQRLSANDIAERWGKLRDRLRELPGEGTPEPAVEAQIVALGPRFRFSSLAFARAAAVVLLTTTLGLSVALTAMRRSALEELRPRLNLPIFELAASDAIERAETRAEILRLPAGADGALLVLTLVDSRSYDGYQAEIRDASTPANNPLWHSSDLQRSPDGIFTIEIRRGFLPASRYRIEIRGLDGGRSELLATYLFAIEYD